MASAFTYPPLTTEGEVRLLTLRPSQAWASPLFCELRSVDLGRDHVSYEALFPVRLTPRDADATARAGAYLVFGGHRHHVAPGLWAALRSMRYREEPRLLWVEAVCVNQADLVERAVFRQPATMMRIYQSARGSISWIGEQERRTEGEGRDSTEAMRCIRVIGGWAERNEQLLAVALADEEQRHQILGEWARVLRTHDWRSVHRLIGRITESGSYQIRMLRVPRRRGGGEGGEEEEEVEVYRGHPGLIYCGRFRIPRSQWDYFRHFYGAVLQYIREMQDREEAGLESYL